MSCNIYMFYSQLEGTTWWTRYRGLTKDEVYENKQLNIDATNDELDLVKLEIDSLI